MKVKEEKRQNRRKQTAEVFTPLSLVDEILDRLPEDSWQEDKTFIDNSCGNGNFLVEVYRYKVERGHDPTHALSTIYGIDIMKDNVAELKLRLYKMAKEYGADLKQVQAILTKNIICADALTYDYEFK
jgi:type I restriction-modification system DNA methylase subunit